MKARFVLMLSAAMMVALPVLAAAQEVKREPARPIASAEGVDSYNAYCAVCHGKDGKGQGPAASALKAAVPDITTLAKRNGGKFASTTVENMILGKDKMAPAHGNADMPIWGPIFRGVSSSDDMAKLRVANLVKYIEGMQAK